MKWKKLQSYLREPSIALIVLKTRWIRLLRRKPGIKYRIEKQQWKTYGKPVCISKNAVRKHKYTDDDKRRIEYYLGNIGKHPASLDQITMNSFPSDTPPELVLTDYEHLRQAAISGHIRDGYTLPLLNLFNLLPGAYRKKKFPYRYGDNSQRYSFGGILAKTRLCDDLSITLLKLEPKRHWEHVHKVQLYDIEYRQKKDIAVWRGATTGRSKTTATRSEFVNKLINQTHAFDVGFSKDLSSNEDQIHLVKDKKSIREQLQCKFLISLEGNDVASGLKWMLHSNSVVMMPKPSISSWLMEETLEPFVHYIPLADDFSDIEEQFEWAVNHEAECIEISSNASQYMNRFLDPRKEVLIECEVMRRYLDHVT